MNDFIVIGGGIAGVSAGARLAQHGTVTLLEAEPALGYHASGRSAALFEAMYGKPAVVALNHASAPYHHEANGGYLSPRGLMLVARTGEEAQFEAECSEMHITPIPLDQARDLLPILNPETVAQAAYHDAAWDIDTDRMIQDFARAIRARGGSVVTGAPVTTIARQAGQWQVETAMGSFRAPILVNAAGAWADRVAAMAGIRPLGIVPHRRSMARLPAPGGRDVSRWPMVFASAETWYAKPDAGKWIVSPADEDPMEPHDAFADDMVLAEGLARYEEMVTEPVTRVESNWAGLRSFAPDRVLVLGPDVAEPAFVWCAGQGGYGFQTAPAASRLLADLVVGAAPELPPEIVSKLRPDRFAG